MVCKIHLFVFDYVLSFLKKKMALSFIPCMMQIYDYIFEYGISVQKAFGRTLYHGTEYTMVFT